MLLSGHHPHILDYQKSCDTSHDMPCDQPASLLIEERVLQTMQWGLVPSWHRGDSPSSFGTVLNNCRHETMLEKPSFRTAIERGRRCVVVADGYVAAEYRTDIFDNFLRFFEWYREKGQRQPYFIYFTDHAPPEEMRAVSAESGGEEKRREKKGETESWEHPTGRMLTMAGLFDIWKSQSAVS